MPADSAPVADRRIALALLVVALAGRFLLPAANVLPSAPDQRSYEAVAESIARGEGFSMNGRPTAFRPPTYPFFLAALHAVGLGAHRAVAFVQGALAAAVAPALFLWLRSRTGRPAAAAAGAVHAVHPVDLPVSAFILTEAVGTVLLFLLVVLLDRAWRSGRDRDWAAAGLAGGVLAYQTMITLLALPLAAAAAVAVRRDRRTLRAAAVALAAFLLLPAAWTARNRLVLGAATPVREYGFASLLWETTEWDFRTLPNPYEPGFAAIERVVADLMRERGMEGMKAELWDRAVENMTRHPVRTAGRFGRAIALAWFEIPGAMKSLDPYPALRWGMAAFHWAVLFAAWTGFLVAARDGRLAPLGFPLAAVLYFSLFLTPLLPIPRYLVPVHPYVAAFAGVGLAAAYGPRKDPEAA